MMQTKMDRIQVAGSGAEKDIAMANAMASIQKKTMQKYGKIMMRIEPIDVKILRAEAFRYTEKFLYFFLARERVKYEVELEITVEVSFLDPEDIQFKEQVRPSTLIEKALGQK